MVKAKTFTLDNENMSYYYIHRHINHFEKDAAIAFFQEQKDINYQIMKNRFKSNYLNNLSGTNRKSLEILDAAMKEDEILSDLDQGILDILNDRVSEAINNYNFEEKIKKAYNSLDSFINTQNAKELDRLLAQITSATKILTNNKSELTFLLGIKKQYAQNRDLTALYQYVESGIQSLNNKMIRVNASRVKSVNNSLLQLIGNLSKQNLNKQVLNGYLKNIFSTQVGEFIVSKGVGKGLELLSKDINNSLTGVNNIEIDNKEVEDLVNQYGQKGKTTFKTDNSFKDLNININDTDNIDINLGISTKWYKGSFSGTVYDATIATETSFVHRLNQMLNGTIEKYYAYNALGLAGQDNEIYSALKSALVAKNLDVLISGLGVQGDFSQYLVINGNFYSI